jgi:hypothetical protein
MMIGNGLTVKHLLNLSRKCMGRDSSLPKYIYDESKTITQLDLVRHSPSWRMDSQSICL